jgi:hypothetical protein
VIARIEHVEATEREIIRSAEGSRIVTSYTVTAVIEVTGAPSMGDAVRRIEQRITNGRNE